jgi:flagellum-specific peptidoglycan hydrolase FlgJ
VFGNTILKNFARDTINNPATNAPKVAAFVAMSTNVAKATNYWRTSEENRERIDSGEDSWKDTLKAYQRVGLLGPIEYGVRFTEALAYGQNPAIATANLGGPVLNDIVGITLYNRGLLETGARKLPFIGTKNLMKKYTGFEPYTPIQEIAKEQDKKNRAAFEKYAEIATGTEERVEGFSERFNKLEGFRSEFNKGGRVGYAEGLGVSKDVSDVKNEPENRIDPFTGQPYAVQSQSLQSSLIREETQEQMSRLGFDKGGRTDNFILKSIKELAKEKKYNFDYEKAFDEDGNRIDNILVNKGDTRSDFVRDIYLNAKARGLKYPEIVASQAAAESRYGASKLAQEANNLFGIKLRKDEEGLAKEFMTKEDYGKGQVPEKANFRVFNSVDESIQGYDNFIKNKRYSKALQAETPMEYLQRIKDAGYATDQSYVQTVGKVYQQYKNEGIFD